MRRIDENSLNSSSSIISESQSTNFSSGQGSQDASIFNDHPGLNTTSERVVELQCIIRERCEALIPDPQMALIVAERLHCDTDNIPEMESIISDLTQNGGAGEAFREAMNLGGQAPAAPEAAPAAPGDAPAAPGDAPADPQIGPFLDLNNSNPGEGLSPLDQFEIVPLIDMHIGNFYFSFTNPSLFMLLTLTFFLLLIHFVTKKGGGNLVPNAWQSLVELLYDFVLNLVKEQIGGLSGNVKQMFFPCILVTFLFLLFCNLQGMIPYSFTVTSHFLITLALSFSLFIGITIVGFQRHGLHFFSFLLPAGVPLPLAPFLVLLELISYCFRALSLGIRLFANMMAGHSLVKILSGFAWTMLCMNEILYFIGALGPLFIVLALTGLELGVAILQAYVFTILICIYLNDAINLH